MSGVDAFHKHCTKLPKLRGQKGKLKCNFCGSIYSGATRMIVHFAGVTGKKGSEAARCQKVLPDVRKAALQHLGMESGQKRSASDETDYEDDVAVATEPPSKQRRAAGSQPASQPGRASIGSSASTQAPITSYTHVLKHAEAQEAIASFLYENGIPFNVTRHPSWFEMWDRVRKAGPGLYPLSYNSYRTTALKQVHA